MSELHKIEINVGENPHNTEVLLDGKPVLGLVGLTLSVRAGYPTTTHLELIGEVIVNHEFVSESALRVINGKVVK